MCAQKGGLDVATNARYKMGLFLVKQSTITTWNLAPPHLLKLKLTLLLLVPIYLRVLTYMKHLKYAIDSTVRTSLFRTMCQIVILEFLKITTAALELQKTF